MGKWKDLAGMQFGRLTATSYIGKIAGKTHGYWECKCSCGVVKNIRTQSLLRNHNPSCGCRKKEVDKVRPAIPFGEAVLNKLYNQSRRNAQIKNIFYELTKEEYRNIVQNNCIYCGELPKENWNPNSNGYFLGNGIDRVNNSVGYVLNNCVPCCGVCNVMKMTNTVDEWLSHMVKILEHYNSERNEDIIMSIPIKNN